MDETCRLRRGEGYGVCADAVVSKCALREKREPFGRKERRAPGFPETSHLKFRFVFPASAKDTPPAQAAPSSVPPAAPFPELHPPE